MCVGPPPPSPCPKRSKDRLLWVLFLWFSQLRNISWALAAELYVSAGGKWHSTREPSMPSQKKVLWGNLFNGHQIVNTYIYTYTINIIIVDSFMKRRKLLVVEIPRHFLRHEILQSETQHDLWELSCVSKRIWKPEYAATACS